MPTKMKLRDLFNSRQIVMMDGALGTELQRRGVSLDLPLWSAGALNTKGDLIRQIHSEYVEAGVEIITANTFRTTAFAYRAAGINPSSAEQATHKAVELAQTASGAKALVAGSMAPLDDCYLPEKYPGKKIAREEYNLLASWLRDAGADLALVETQINMEEARLALQAAVKNGLPAIVSFLVDENQLLWGGGHLSEAIAMVEREGAAAVMVNCLTLPLTSEAVKVLAENATLPFGVYANAGKSHPEIDGTIHEYYSDDDYTIFAGEWITAGAMLVGGCCGTTPATLRKLRGVITGIVSQ